MEINNLLEFTERQQLREWLGKYHTTESSCWVACSKSPVAKEGTLAYLDIVEEALCFGWIDSTLKRLPDGRTAQRLSPRRKGSHWTKLNIQRCHDLADRGLMTPAGSAALRAATRKQPKTNTLKMMHLVLLLSLFGLVSCSNQTGVLTDSDKADIHQMIESHDNTLIYIWADYCQASKNMLEENIKPHLEGLEKNNVGIVIIHYGEEDAVADLKSNNRLVINMNSSLPLLIKLDINKTMHKLLNNYRNTNAMPIPLLVNKDGGVENYDEEDGYYSYIKIISYN